ncbi:outer membrane lipoprotein [Cellvibrio sp. BR]|jgi:outer membrane protein assembly factor BamE|uniref:outer membrane protein assembly factor BamE n=1 Tax=unclassified Cellvibrio TaxID=2624793 RepID=UPI000260154C|nr:MULTISPECIES: outer membrane protein assembly factor BamE [unclassified Cellvibrio]EIK46774.1 outer membrane lipoprotein [Cellvibrio sp. BR]UUA71332.1 outer membrane protein assembly factor BamE [Cellvibrio sp. QJXJ]
MKLASRVFLALVFIAGLTACSSFRFPGVYKVGIQQGHIITQEMVDQLKLGMNKRQVRFVLGNTLLPNTFNDDRWDYPYSVRRGSQGEITQYLYTVYFENDKLVKTEGDFLPGKAPMSGEKSKRYLDDMQRDVPVPTEDSTPPDLPDPEELE